VPVAHPTVQFLVMSSQKMYTSIMIILVVALIFGSYTTLGNDCNEGFYG